MKPETPPTRTNLALLFLLLWNPTACGAFSAPDTRPGRSSVRLWAEPPSSERVQNLLRTAMDRATRTLSEPERDLQETPVGVPDETKEATGSSPGRSDPLTATPQPPADRTPEVSLLLLERTMDRAQRILQETKNVVDAEADDSTTAANAD